VGGTTVRFCERSRVEFRIHQAWTTALASQPLNVDRCLAAARDARYPVFLLLFPELARLP